MRAMIRVLPMALVALLMLIAVACGSSGTVPSTSNETGDTGEQTVADDPSGVDDTSDDVVSASPIEVLSGSAKSFQEEVQSVQSEMEFSVGAGTFSISADAEMAFQAPDQMYMTMDLAGLGSFEMLVSGDAIYMNVPPAGWVVFSLEDMLGDTGLTDLGFDVESFQDTFSGHSFLGYESLLQSVGGEVVDLGEETLDGGTYRHFRGDVDFAAVAAAFSDAFGAAESLNLDTFDGPLTFDVWVDPETSLPYKLQAGGEIAFGTEAMVFDATMTFFGYNEPVEFPTPPADALTLEEFLSAAFQQQ